MFEDLKVCRVGKARHKTSDQRRFNLIKSFKGFFVATSPQVNFRILVLPYTLANLSLVINLTFSRTILTHFCWS
jgi:hypothetical protein